MNFPAKGCGKTDKLSKYIHILNSFTIMDLYFVRFNKLEKLVKLVDLKAISFMRQDDERQLLNYLKATTMEIGLLANFGQKSLVWKRMINTPSV